MRNLRLIATVLFVAVLLVGIVLLLRQTNVQNDTSVTSAQPVSGQQLAASRVATDPPVKKGKKIVPTALSADGKKMNPMKQTNPTANQANQTLLGTVGSSIPTSSQQKKNTTTSSEVVESENIRKLDMKNAAILKRSKKDALKNFRKGKLNTNNNNQ